MIGCVKFVFRMLHDFYLPNRQRLKLWQREGESYEHVLMKALGYAMFIQEYPNMQVEAKLRLRYKPDLVAFDEKGELEFWGECGQNSIKKTHWILKHTRVKRLVLFKIGMNAIESLIKQIRQQIPEKYRQNKLLLVNFVSDIVDLTASKNIEEIPEEWFTKFLV